MGWLLRLESFMLDVVDLLTDGASEVGAAFTEAAHWLEDVLSDPWTAGVFATYIALASTLALLSRRATAVRRRSGLRVATVVLALAIATFGGATFRWSFFLPGVWLVGVGTLSLWGSEINERFILPRRVAHIHLMPQWIIGPTNTRNSSDLGFLCIAIGLAMAGGGTLHAVAALLAILPVLRRVARYETALRKSGDASKYTPPIWGWSVSAVILGGLFAAAATGALLDRHYSWIDVSSPSSEGPLVLQALLAIEIGIASLSAAAIGLAVQLRSSSFGSDIAFSQLRRNQLVVSFGSHLLVIVATVYVLGHWNGAKDPFEGLFPSLVVHSALLTSAWVVVEAAWAVLDLARVRKVVDSVSGLALANEWQAQMRLYGWNAYRRSYGPSPASQTPESVHLLIQAVQGAFRIGDLELLEDILTAWVANALTQPAIAQFERFAPTADELEKALFVIELGWKDAACLDGLDIALAQVVRNASAIPGAGSAYIRALMPLVRLTYPPFSKDSRHHEIRGFNPELPGFRTLDELTSAATQVRDDGAVRWLLHSYWRRRARLAICWAERLTPDDEKNGRYPRLAFAERLFELLGNYAGVPASGSRSTVREDVVRVIVDAVSAAESRAAIAAGLNKIYAVADYDDDTLWHLWDDLKAIAEKPRTNTGLLLSILDRSVSRTVSLDGREPTVSFGVHSFFEFCSALSLTIASIDEEDDEGARSGGQQEHRLAEAVWTLARWAVERSQDPDAGVTYWFPTRSMQNWLREFLSNCSLSVAWKVADAVWDWAAERPAERAWLASSIDGPWLRGQ